MSVAFRRQEPSSYRENPDRLIRILRKWGVSYLVSPSSPRGRLPALSPVQLIEELAQCKYPRIRDASIALYLLHPELADAALEAYQTNKPVVADQIATLLLATLYLQRVWKFRLTLALGHQPGFPEQRFALMWEKRHLPPPRCGYGSVGLAALQGIEQVRRGLPLNFIVDWQNQIDHLLLQEEVRHHQTLITPTIPEIDDGEQECSEMSMRQRVTRTEIEQFLKDIGKNVHQPGRVYLAGGAALVHMGIRSGSTLDIDVAIEAADEDELIMAIRHIVQQRQINVEFASPGDFIPLPSQWMSQAKYVGRYGSVDVFYFDFYSLALSKISRGSDRDLIDVKLLLQHKLITLDELDTAYQEILPRMGKRPYINLDPQKFASRYAQVRQELSQ